MILAYLAALAASPQAESPRQFVARVYASYAREDYSPLARPGSVFAPMLVREIREDQRLAKGEVGYLDGDPLCDCQDYDMPRAPSTAVFSLVDHPARIFFSFASFDWRIYSVISVEGVPG